MSHLLFWPTIIFFYPVGNTSAVCLTENLPPESKADVLLLACGDPRHILYTIHTNEANPLSCQRTFDITCCDVDAAILARNTLLFTFLADDGMLDKVDNLWNLFYHMLVDQATLSMLIEQCRKLVSLAESMEAWRAGPYGHFLTVCDAGTLAELRRIWTTYLDMATLSSKQAKQFEQRFMASMKEMFRKGTGGTTTASRSAGPLAFHVGQAVSRQFSSYWSSGTTDTQNRGQKQHLTFNPTFAFSIDGDKFAVHYGTDPLCGFHLAEAFVSGKFTSPDEPTLSHEVVRVAKEQFSRWCTSVNKRLKDCNPSSPTFVIRMFAGDALMFCQALKYCQVTHSPVTPYNVAAWRLSTITLDDHYYGYNAVSPAPRSFNVIDTSNILDHAGLVNVLVVTAPLLQKSPSARLYTEALLKTGGNPSQIIYDHVCGDLPTMALLLGIIPSTFISQFTMRSIVHESMIGGAKQYHERLAWQAVGFGGHKVQDGSNDVPAPSQRLSFPPKDLANILFRTYLQMFSHENMKNRFQQLFSLSPERKLQALQHSGILHYNRRSFALLVHMVKTRIQTNWFRTMELFEQLVMMDRQLPTGQQAYQELCCQLLLLGLYTTEWISLPALCNHYWEFDAHDGLFRDWSAPRIPQVVTLVLVVPRDAIARLERDFEEVGTPMMQCQTDDGPRQNWFAVTSATFGTLRVSGTGEHRTAVVSEGRAEKGVGSHTDAAQPLSRSGAPMIVTFSVPSASVMDFGRNPRATVGLGLRATPGVSFKFMNRLGFDLMVYRTKLMDAERVFVLARPPVVSTSAGSASGPSDAGADRAVMDGHWQQAVSSLDMPQRATADVHVQMDDTFSTVQSFTIRIDVTDPGARAALADTETVPTISSSLSSTRSLDMCMKIGTHTFPLQFPLPVDVTRAKLRVARRSSYVEVSCVGTSMSMSQGLGYTVFISDANTLLLSFVQVIAPLASFDVQPERGLSTRLAPLSSYPNDDGTPTLGSIHYLNLDRCPTFKVSNGPSGLDWCYLHVGLMFSELEKKRALSGETKPPPVGGSSSSTSAPDPFLRVKQTLHHLLRAAADAARDGNTPERVFALGDALRREEPYLYIIVAHMRLDVGSHTVVADAFVAPGTPVVWEVLDMASSKAPKSMGERGSQETADAVIEHIATDADETAAWFHLLPYLTERCRTWPHKTSCTYRTTKHQEPEKPSEQNPLCMCGVGVGTEILPKSFGRVAPYLTRAAFSPLFPVPYLKEVDMPGGDPLTGNRGAWSATTRTTRNRGLQVGQTDAVGAVGHRCRSCSKEGSLVCSRCKCVRYCSKECQRADWKVHKKDCGSAIDGACM